MDFVFIPKHIFRIKKFRIWAVNTLTAEGIYKLVEFGQKREKTKMFKHIYLKTKVGDPIS